MIIKRIGKILAFITAIILFVLLVQTILLTTTKNLVTRSNLTNYIKEGNILSVKASFFLDIEDKNITLIDKIENMALEVGIPQDIVKDILESNELNELLGEYFSQTINYVLKNTSKPTLSDETVNKMVSAALESYQRHINITLEEEDLKASVITYTNNLKKLMPERLDVIGDSKLANYLQESLQFNSYYLYIVMAILVVLIGMFTWSFHKPLKYLAIPLIISGALFVTLGSSDGIINDLVMTKVVGFEAMMSPLITNLLTLWFKCGVFFSFIGVFLLVIYAAIVRILKH